MVLIELFGGIGSQLESCKRINWEIDKCFCSEIDKNALTLYQLFHGQPNNLGDITQIESLPVADIVTYSFPCQDISIAGKQKGFIEGTQSNLLYQVGRLLQNSPLPKVLIMENVKNLTSTKFLPQFQGWITFLDSLGYQSKYQVLKSSSFGGATIRERVFLVSAFNKTAFQFPSPTHTTLDTIKTVQDILEPIEEQYLISQPWILERDFQIKTTKSERVGIIGCGGQGNRIYSRFSPGITLTAQGGGTGGKSGLYLREDGNVYKLSPIECFKLMGWDRDRLNCLEESALSDNQLYGLIGNAISLEVLDALFKAIKQQYF